MPPTLTKLMNWEVLGSGQAIAGNDGSQAANVPASTEIIHIASENGVSYYQFGGIASALSSGYVPQDGRVIEGPLRNLTALSIFAATGVVVHVQYYRRNTGR